MVFNVSDSKERQVTPEQLPFKDIIKVEHIAITMKCGAQLYAHLWIPESIYSNKTDIKVGTIVEYLPYRKNDFTSVRDSIRHPYYVGYGFASMRVDMRGCGDSDGVIHGEYLLQEQNDNLEIFDWIIKQPWSNGNIAQFGKSWGGFNGLQIAARNHPALKTIITLCSTDDRYADDVHYRGGCLMASDMLWWASTMFAYNARSQDPEIRSNWRQNWLKRLELEPNVIDWVSHQTRDEFWKHGSICEDYNKVDIPVLAVGGWKDGYTNSIFRMMENLPNSDCRSIIGPWVHEFPEVAMPGPTIGYNQIAVSWFCRHLNTDDRVKAKIEGLFNVDSLSLINAYIQDPVSTDESYEYRPGSWKGVNNLKPEFHELWMNLEDLKLQETNVKTSSSRSFSGFQEYGIYRGTWCPFGQAGDFPPDQRIEDSKSFNFDSSVFETSMELLGAPEVSLTVSSDTEMANLSVRLTDLNPETNEHFLVSWGILNLNRFIGSSETPKPLKIGEKYNIKINLDCVGYKVEKNHRLRVSLSTTDWPSFWPSAKIPTLTLEGDNVLRLPKLTTNTNTIEFPQAQSLPPCGREILRTETRTRKVVHDISSHSWEIDDYSDEGKRLIVSNNMELGSWNKNKWIIKENDPLSAFNQCDWEMTLGRGSWQTKLLTTSTMESNDENFLLHNKLEAYEGKEKVFEKQWNNTIARNFC